MTWFDLVMLYIIMTLCVLLLSVIMFDSKVIMKAWWLIMPKVEISLPCMTVREFGNGSISYGMGPTYYQWLEDHVGRQGVSWIWDWSTYDVNQAYWSYPFILSINTSPKDTVTIKALRHHAPKLMWLQLTYA